MQGAERAGRRQPAAAGDEVAHLTAPAGAQLRGAHPQIASNDPGAVEVELRLGHVQEPVQIVGRHDGPDVELAAHAGAGAALVERGEQPGMDLLGARLDRRTAQRGDLATRGGATVQLAVQAPQPRARHPGLEVHDGDPSPAAEQLGRQRQARYLIQHAHDFDSMADVATWAGPIHRPSSQAASTRAAAFFGRRSA